MRILQDLDFTIEERRKFEEKLEEVQDTNRKLEEKMKKVEEENKKIQQEKMSMELHLADVVDDYKCKTDATRTKMKKIKKCVVEKEMHLHYALGAIVILVIIIVDMYAIYLCTR